MIDIQAVREKIRQDEIETEIGSGAGLACSYLDAAVSQMYECFGDQACLPDESFVPHDNWKYHPAQRQRWSREWFIPSADPVENLKIARAIIDEQIEWILDNRPPQTEE